MKEEEDMAPGWDAIEDAMTKLYGSQMPMHYGSSLPAMFGGDPLDGISVYKADHPAPHWHMVTFGFTELYGKEKEDKEHSGFGFELTFRLESAARRRSSLRHGLLTYCKTWEGIYTKAETDSSRAITWIPMVQSAWVRIQSLQRYAIRRIRSCLR